MQWLRAILTLVILCAAACSLYSLKSKELAALDQAYDKGLLTNEEYDAKKAALKTNATAIAALDKAFDAGVLTRDEYMTKKAALLTPPRLELVQTPTPSAPVPAALSQPAPAIVTAQSQTPLRAPVAPSSVANAHTLRMKVLNVVD